jgi:hypothetical protein
MLEVGSPEEKRGFEPAKHRPLFRDWNDAESLAFTGEQDVVLARHRRSPSVPGRAWPGPIQAQDLQGGPANGLERPGAYYFIQ